MLSGSFWLNSILLCNGNKLFFQKNGVTDIGEISKQGIFIIKITIFDINEKSVENAKRFQ